MIKHITIAALLGIISLSTAQAACPNPIPNKLSGAELRECFREFQTAIGNLSKPDLSGLEGKLAAANSQIEALKSKVQELETKSAPVARESIPTGAVVAFDPDIKTQAACPTGWSHFEPSGGRVIIGAGDHDNKWFREGEADPVSLTIYPSYGQDERAGIQEKREARATGGEEEVVLKETQMPAHSHRFGVNKGSDFQGVVLADKHGSYGGVQTEQIGRSQPHNNMPPYIALYFCKKN